MKVALTLMNQAWENKSANVNSGNELTMRSLRSNADLIIFPEMTLTGFTSAIPSVAEEIGASASLRAFVDMATKHNIGVVAGVILKTKGSYHNCAVAFDRHGEQLGCYRKIHPFSPSGENGYITGGEDMTTFEYEGIKFGLTICYDLRFPVLWHALAEKCDCIINIANWPARRVDHWKTLLKARAIENQVYVIGVNRIGVDGNNLEYVESSIAFSPDGAEITPIATDQNLRVIEIQKATVGKCQNDFPIRNDRRPVLYNKFLKENAKT